MKSKKDHLGLLKEMHSNMSSKGFQKASVQDFSHGVKATEAKLSEAAEKDSLKNTGSFINIFQFKK